VIKFIGLFLPQLSKTEKQRRPQKQSRAAAEIVMFPPPPFDIAAESQSGW